MQIDPSLPWRDIRRSGFSAHLGHIRFAEAGAAEWHAALALEDHHMNVNGVCHGGVLLTLADVAMGAASFAATQHPCATIQLDSQFIAPARGGQTLLAVARQLRRTRELSFMDCEVWAEGRQVMRASGIWKYLASRRPAETGDAAS